MAEFHNPNGISSGRTQRNYTYRRIELIDSGGYGGVKNEGDIDEIINIVLEELKKDGAFDDVIVDENKIANNVVQYLIDNDLLKVDINTIISDVKNQIKNDSTFVASLKGDKGDPGQDGKDGKNGIDGKDGAPGPKGDPGADGKDGASPTAADVAIELKADTTFVASLKGDKGDPGQDRKDGKDGAPGPKGDPGADGQNGIDGQDGAPGPKGDPGADGKDADPQDVADILKADADFVAACKGDKGDPGQDGADGSASDISVSAESGNATIMKDDGIYTPDLSDEIETVDSKVDTIKKYQKYLNTELEYGVLGIEDPADAIASLVDGNMYIPLAVGDNIPFNTFRQGTVEYDLTNHSFKLKAGKVYRLYFLARGWFIADDETKESSYRVEMKNITTGNYLPVGRYVQVPNEYASCECIYSPEEDCEIVVQVSYDGGSAKTLINQDQVMVDGGDPIRILNTPEFTCIEIARAIEIDPIEYANSEKGIEDVAVGTIVPFMGNTAPNHYLACDGTEYNITDYAYLAEYIKDEFGTYNHFGGDGTTTFAVPDLRGEFLRGTGTNSHSNQGNGADVGTHQDGTTVSLPQCSTNSDMWFGAGMINATNVDKENRITGYRSIKTGTISAASDSSSSQSITTRPTNTSVLWCIKYEPTYFLHMTTNVDVASYADQVGQGEDTPVGQIISFMGTTAPENYLFCDGTVYNISDYPDLATFFNTQFGSINKFGGDGTTTFAVPDLRGEFLRGTGNNSRTNQGNGADVGAHQDATRHVRIEIGAENILYSPGKGNNRIYSNHDSNYSIHTITGRNSVQMNTTDTHTLQPEYYTSRPTNTSVMYCIKAVRTFSMKIEDAKIYSEDERVVGKWIDGKILYQKTIAIPANLLFTTSDMEYTIPINGNVDTIVPDKAFLVVDRGDGGKNFLETSYVSAHTDANYNIGYYLKSYDGVNGIVVNSQIPTPRQLITDATFIVSVQYTKK